jgi:hypothetical protein
MNKKNKETTNYANSANVFFDSEGKILHFNLSFCFLIFNI